MTANAGDMIAKAIKVNKAISTDWLTDDIGPFKFSRTVRLSIWMDAGGIANMQIANGGVTVVENLNGGTAIPADARHTFDVELAPGDALNVQHSTGGTQDISLRIHDVPKT